MENIIYDIIRKNVRIYKKSRDEEAELASQCWLEFFGGGYIKIYSDPPTMREVMRQRHERKEKLLVKKVENRIKAHEESNAQLSKENKERAEKGLSPLPVPPLPVPEPYQTKPFKPMPHERFQEIFMYAFVKTRALREMTIQQMGDKRANIEIEIESLEIVTPSPEDELLLTEKEKLMEKIRRGLMERLPVREKRAVAAMCLGWNRRQVASAAKVSLGTAQNIIKRLEREPEIKLLKEVYGE